MTTTFKTLAATAALAMAVASPLSAQNAGEDMLLSAVMNEVSRLGIETDELDNLSLNDLVSIAAIVRSEDPRNVQKGKVETVIENAGK